MHWLALIALLLALIYGPQFWVRSVLARYHRKPEVNFPGTGGELARHILDRFDLQDVKVEATDLGDHYDPLARCVRLTEDKLQGRTLTSITVAAHECGHALQHATRQPLFMWRTRFAGSALWANRIGSFLLFAAPMIGVLSRAPSSVILTALGAFLILGFGLLLHLLTLPMELDASFGKALPILKGGYLEAAQVPAAERILRAAALTYVAASLASLLNFWRWLAVLRR